MRGPRVGLSGDGPLAAIWHPPPMASRVRSPKADPRTVALLALFMSLVAIALEIAYTVGQFVLSTFHRLG